MFQFILTNIFLISVGTILYLVARTLPRLDEEAISPKRSPLLERWITSGIPEKIDALTNTYAGKLFRRLKVFLMRFDNYLSGKLKKINQNGSNGKQKIESFEKLRASSEQSQGADAEKLEEESIIAKPDE